jgi:hypothetical protein
VSQITTTSESRWESIDLPVLRAVLEVEQPTRPGEYVDGNEIARKLGLSDHEAYRSFELLHADGLIDADFALGGSVAVSGLTPQGLRALGQWQSSAAMADVVPELLGRLADKAQTEGDSDESKALARGAEILQGVATGTLTALIRQLTGLHS